MLRRPILYALSFGSLLWMTHCSQTSSNDDQGLTLDHPHSEPDSTDAELEAFDASIDPSKIAAMQKRRKEFLTQHLSTVKNQKYFYSTAMINTELSNHYEGVIPKTVFLMDYPSSAQSFFQESSLLIRFDPAFEMKLPKDIRKTLAKCHLLDKGLVDIFLNVQGNNFLGEEEDHKDGSTLTTRLKAHAWLDPNPPHFYAGNRLNRDVQMGIYDSDFDIADEVKIGRLHPFNVSIHDNVFSPRTARIKIGRNSPSQSFWSLTIDDKNNESVRANATLHWVLTGNENHGLESIIYESIPILSGSILNYDELAVKDLGDLLLKLSESNEFKDTPFFRKLNSLFI